MPNSPRHPPARLSELPHHPPARLSQSCPIIHRLISQSFPHRPLARLALGTPGPSHFQDHLKHLKLSSVCFFSNYCLCSQVISSEVSSLKLSAIVGGVSAGGEGVEAGVSGKDAPVGNGDTRPSENPRGDCGSGLEGSGGFAHHLLGVLWWRGLQNHRCS